MIGSLVNLVIWLVVIGCIIGLLIYLVRRSPVPDPYKGWIEWVILAVAIIIIIYLLLGLVGANPPTLKLGAK